MPTLDELRALPGATTDEKDVISVPMTRETLPVIGRPNWDLINAAAAFGIRVGPRQGPTILPERRSSGRAPRPAANTRSRGSRRTSSTSSRGSPTSTSDPDEPPPHPLALALELVRDDRDMPYWRPVETVAGRARLEVVATAWLYEAEPPPGAYRLERGGARLEVHHTGRGAT